MAEGTSRSWSLARDVPTAAGIARFSTVDALRRDESLQIFGVRQGEAGGNNVTAQYAGLVDAGLAQVDGNSFAKAFIEPGYSGGAVRDASDSVVGMVSAKSTNGKLLAYMIPVWVLRAIVPGLKPTARKSSSVITTKRERRGATEDALTLFSHHCAALVRTAFPAASLSQSSHARSVSGVPGERYYYIADAGEELNSIMVPETDDYPLSYEFYFQNSVLNSELLFGVALWFLSAEYDKALFGIVKFDERVQSYLGEIARGLPSVSANRLHPYRGRELP